MNAKHLPQNLTAVTGKLMTLPGTRFASNNSAAIVKAIEKERLHFGQELHDNVNQLLSSAMLYISLLKPATETQKAHKAKGLELVRKSIREIQDLSRGIIAPGVKTADWLISIRSLLNDLEVTKAVKIAFQYTQGKATIPAAVKLALYRIIQEQVKNIVSHSKASQLEMSIINNNDTVNLVLKDNGIGMRSTKGHTGIGLSNIQDRVRALGGILHINTSPGKGCSIEVSIPLKRKRLHLLSSPQV